MSTTTNKPRILPAAPHQGGARDSLASHSLQDPLVRRALPDPLVQRALNAPQGGGAPQHDTTSLSTEGALHSSAGARLSAHAPSLDALAFTLSDYGHHEPAQVTQQRASAVSVSPQRGESDGTLAANDSSAPAASSAAAPMQLKRYTVERDLDLSLATKTWKAQGTKGVEGYQSAKTRARGQLYADLRAEYPASRKDGTQEEKDQTRGEEFLEQKRLIDAKFDNINDDEATVNTTRPAILPNAEMGTRRKSSQAGPISKINTDEDWIGAHLVKREWGGADNMWNVVAWPKKAENFWAKHFERPVDSRGLNGEDPGNIKIVVVKEDELITRDIANKVIDLKAKALGREARTQSKTFFKQAAGARAAANRALEAVPVSASGTNEDGVTTVDGSMTAFDPSQAKVLEFYETKVTEALNRDDEEKAHERNPLPTSMDVAEERSATEQLKERTTDWKAETDNYPTEKGFKHTNTLF